MKKVDPLVRPDGRPVIDTKGEVRIISKMTITPEKKARLVAAAAEFDAAMEAIYGPRISTEGGDVDPSPEAFAIAVQAEMWTHFSANQRTINKAKMVQIELNRAQSLAQIQED